VTQYLSRIGVTVNLKSQPWSVFAGQRKNKELGIFLYGWGHPQGPAQMISFAFPSRDKALGLGASNYSNYQNAAFDAAMKAWAVETDDTTANAHIADAMKILMEDLPGIPLYYQHTIWAHRADLKVNGRQDERTSATTVSRK
jgi:peptide/nickel transport system substrate-binding protein